ncbi:MAG TPA: hypothetical protein VFH74_15285 [Gaiellales bacterium]|nr:hypothetical protein [Gaiellales bacterium]
MATEYETGGQSARGSSEYVDPGNGWVTFAMTVVMMIGALNIIEGVVALTDSKFYAKHAVFVFSGLHTWGWIMIVLGILQFTAGYVLYAGSQWARWFIVATCAINGIGQLMFVQAYPFWCLTLFAIDVVVIYAASRYGSRAAAANR